MKHRPKHIAEYVLLRGFAGLVGVLPYRVALAIGWGVAAFGFHIVRWRRAEAERRIREVFGDTFPDREVRRIAWLSLRNLCFQAIETLLAARLNRTWLEKYADCDGPARTLAAQVAKGEGAILAVIHMGNWEAAGLGMAQLGIPMLVIARSQKNPLFNDYMNRQRRHHDSVVVDRDDRGLMKTTQAWLGDGNVMAILVDLRAKQAASRFSFLGRDADLGRGVGMISRSSGSPIFRAITRREGWTRHIWTLEEPIYPDPALDRKTDSIRMTQACLDFFGQVIRENPDQYFWYNKRWVLEPLVASVHAQAGDGVVPNET